MRRRQGYTLIELLVAMALILLIMSILSAAYVQGLDTFSRLKAIGDMAEQLRAATTALRRDLAADHFTGAVRLSDPNFLSNPPREGYFSFSNAGSYSEGADLYTNSSAVSPIPGNPPNSFLSFSVKLRGNRMEDFLAVPQFPDLPALTFFAQPQDAYYNGYQWGEVAYFLTSQNQSTVGPGGQQPLYSLYRAQRAVVANSPGQANPAYLALMSISAATGNYNYNTPSDLVTPQNRAALNNAPGGSALILSNVLNFEIQVLPVPTAGGFSSFVPQAGSIASYDTGMNPGVGLYAVQITLRVYDIKTRQARQITVIQDL